MGTPTRVDDEMASYAQALAVRADYPEAHFNAGWCRMLRGDFGGWEEYEWRWETGQLKDSKRHFARVAEEGMAGVSFARGTLVDMEFDEEQFVGGGVYLFAAVLEYFLGLYVSINSFSQLPVWSRR